MPTTLLGRRVLLTGASGGIGKAIARAVHARGATVIATARRVDVLEELRAELGKEVETLACDLSDAEAVAALPGRAGQVDVLVANAALPGSGPALEFEPEDIDRTLDVNLRAPMQLARALAPPMVERGHGSLVFISSISGKIATPGSALYSATKFGLRGFSFGLNQDLRTSGVGVTTVFPGFVRDAGMFADAGVKLPSYVPTVTPEQVADAVVKGIETGRAEIDVAPLVLRSGGWISGAAPVALAAFNRKLGSEKISSEMGVAQKGKR